MDSDSNYIDSITADLYITMENGKAITDVVVEMASDVVGATDSIRIYYRTPSPLQRSFNTYITFPDEIVPPEKTSSNHCWSNADALRNKQHCFFSGQEVTLSLAPVSSIQASDWIYYRIENVRNPLTGDVTDNFLIEVKDYEGYMVAESTGLAITA